MTFFEKFIKTSRYDKPHGILLLFYPCVWGLYLVTQNIADVLVICIIFLIGACGMRSLGCIWNDLKDKRFDNKVERTKYRLIAQGKVSKTQIISFMAINLLIGTFPLFFIPFKAILISFCVLPLIIIYPFMKRITWYPQLWLGVTFNWGVIVGYNSVSNNLFSMEMLTMYIGCILWTLAYDTVYGFQDIKDDKKIGIKSTSIKFKKNSKLFLLICYLLSFSFFILTFFLMASDILIIYFMAFLLSIIAIKIYKIDLYSNRQCHKFFIFNSYCGFVITIILFSFK